MHKEADDEQCGRINCLYSLYSTKLRSIHSLPSLSSVRNTVTRQAPWKQGHALYKKGSRFLAIVSMQQMSHLLLSITGHRNGVWWLWIKIKNWQLLLWDSSSVALWCLVLPGVVLSCSLLVIMDSLIIAIRLF